jgi:hypothetical protein
LLPFFCSSLFLEEAIACSLRRGSSKNNKIKI